MKRKCAICRTPATRITPAGKGWCGGEDCGAQLALALLEKQRAKRERQDRKARRDRLKSRSEWLADVQSVFNAMIRERDAGLPCVSCGRPDDGLHQRHASHYLSRGSHPELRFEPTNVHASCATCNNHLSGNLIPYRAELIRRIGQEAVDRLEGPHQPRKWTVDDLRAMKAQYNAELRRLRAEHGR